MKSILLSIKPKWVAKILNGEKTIEVRNRFPKDYKGWVYIYCTKDKTFAHFLDGVQVNGKVVARFYCDKVEEIIDNYNSSSVTKTLNEQELLEKSCLTEDELLSYLPFSSLNYKCEWVLGYAIHISQLEIFDRPRELSEFKQEWYDCGNNFHSKPLTKAPQSYMFIEVEE